MSTITRRGVRKSASFAKVELLLGMAVAAALAGCQGYTFTEIASGFDILPNARAALAEDGTVVASEASRFLVGDGSSLAPVDLSGLGLEVTAPSPRRRPVRVRTEGDIAFVADHPTAMGCMSGGRGAYRISTSGGPLTTYFESCLGPGVGVVGTEMGLSANGTVAFSQITNGQGALYRGPVSGPVSVLRSGTGTFFNTQTLDVSDAGRVAVQMEYSDGFAGGLMRGILVFDQPEQDKAVIDTAIEKLGIGTQPPLAINASGEVAFSLPFDVSFPIGGTVYNFPAGVYRATPTLFNTPKSLTLIADLGGEYCGFGAVDINDAGDVVFEARLDGELGCTSGTAFDGLFVGPDSNADAVVVRGNSGLGAHQYFDDIRLGEMNGAGQVSFTTTYSEPLVDPIKVWRADKNGRARRR